MNIKPFIEAVERQKLKVEGVIVFQGGSETARYRRIPEQKRNVFSVSKSFSSIAVGMAIDDGKLKLSDRVTRFFPRENSGNVEQDKRWDALTLEHLLTMNMGHSEFTRPRSVKEALSYELARDPGTFFLYDNTCTFLASAMLTKATGLKLRDFLLERLFRPLGFVDPGWEESDDGYTLGATALQLTTSEMALFGQFLLQRGNWKGKQLVSASWIDRATRTQVPTRPEQDKPDYDLGYGYQFWTCRHGAYRCDGKDGQFVVVLPAIDAVVTVNSDEENMKPILWTVWDYILPALQE
jgi:CubicO group peptidase (beta-lactamase class C family)